MITTLPNEIIISIVNMNAGLSNGYHSFMEVDIREILKLRNINTEFRALIDSISNLWDFKNNMNGLPEVYYNRVYREKTLKWSDYKYGSRRSIDEQFTELCQKNASKESVEWLFRNNIFLSLKNIKYLIINNRIDIIKMSLLYEENQKIIFNRFHLGEILDKQNDILSSKGVLHPLIIAGNNGMVEIIDLLLNFKKGIFNKEIPKLLDISIKYNYEKLLSYLVVNYYNIISNHLQNKLSAIINRVENCQGLLFYLMNSNKIKVSQKLLIGCINQAYTDLFKFCYEKHYINDNENIDLMKECIHYNNVEILNYLMNDKKCKITPEKFSFYFLKKRTYTPSFISNIVNYHRTYIKKSSNIIHLSIKYEIHELLIRELVYNNYKYTNEEMKMAIDLNKYSLVEDMCKNIKNKK